MILRYRSLYNLIASDSWRIQYR